MLSKVVSSIFLSFWYDLTWDWTMVSLFKETISNLPIRMCTNYIFLVFVFKFVLIHWKSGPNIFLTFLLEMFLLFFWGIKKNDKKKTSYLPFDFIYTLQLRNFAVFLIGASGIRARWSTEDRCQTQGGKAPGFDWATFRWASCIDRTALH